jgi:DGQHR domain-containing protein
MPVDISVQKMYTIRKKTLNVVGVITAGTLVEHYVIPRRDTRKKTGYQRELATARVNRLVKELTNRTVDLPTALLLNLRDYSPDLNLFEQDGHSYFRLHDGESLYVVDGQHRVEALSRLVQTEPLRWTAFEIPFVCMLGASEREEMEQFYVVNSTAKSVRTDLALDLLRQRAETDPEVLEALLEHGASWKVDAQVVTEELAQTRLWRGRVRFPGDTKGETMIGSAGMAGSLKQLLNTPYFGAIKQPNQIKIIDAYWQGIRNVIPAPFEKPEEYALQKSTGVMVMHALLVSIIEYVRSNGKSLFEPTSFEEALRETLQELEGDTSSGELARGADFWRAGSQGAAGSFSSNSGRRVLVAKLRASLPEVQVE